MFFWPWKISKKFKVNDKIYDSILVLIITAIFIMIGGVLWLAGMLAMANSVIQLLQSATSFYAMMDTLGKTVIMMGFGSVFIIAGKEFSKVTDSNKIYAYSASVLAVVSCVVAILSYMK